MRCAHASGLRSFEAVVDEADKAPSLVRHAHCSDLTILSQAERGAAGRRDMVEQVVMHSARPTLVVPYAGRFHTRLAERVLGGATRGLLGSAGAEVALTTASDLPRAAARTA